MSPSEVPTIVPKLLARPLAPAEILRLASGELVPGVDEADPRVQAIRRCSLDNPGRLAIRQACERGFLWLNPGLNDTGRLDDLWSWWCAAARRPEIIVTVDRKTDGVQVVCDVSPTGHDLSPAALIHVGRALLESNQHGGWILTPDVIEVDGLDTESALTLVEQLLGVITRSSR